MGVLVLLVALVLDHGFSTRFKHEHDDPDEKKRGPACPRPAFHHRKHRRTRPILWNSYGVPMESLWNPYGTSRPPRQGNRLATRLQHAQQPLHSCHQVGIRCLHHPVEEVGHQTEALNLKGGLSEALRQSRDDQHAVILDAKDRLTYE